jgi:phosphodiesterase/alkaline phosphatase D-like protein
MSTRCPRPISPQKCRSTSCRRAPTSSTASKHAGIRNTVWLSANVPYTAAHYYDPGKAQFRDFEPFWEFVSGPIHAGAFGPNTLDNTFGPQLVFQKTPAKDQQMVLYDVQLFA